MTYHSSLAWKFEDGASDEAIQEIVHGLQRQRDYAKAQGRTGYTTMCYMTLSHIDNVIINLSHFLDNEPITTEKTQAFSDAAPGVVREMLPQILAELKLE